MSECTHDCASCSQECGQRQEPQKDKLNELSSVKKVIAVVSGKGGVGKSLVTSLLAVLSQRQGLKTAIMDADITGPSIPKAFGVHERLAGSEFGFFPAQSKTGIDIVSLNLLLEHETDPVIWRGALIAGTVKQFWTDAIWKDEDIMFIDMPPGTGDVPLTVFQSIPVDGIVIVASPQELVSMIVEKAVNMAKLMNIPIVGLAQNMSYVECPKCKEKIYVFGENNVEDTAKKFGIKSSASLPISKDYATVADRGLMELFEGDYLDSIADEIEKTENKKQN